jgi:hypothetical protein
MTIIIVMSKGDDAIQISIMPPGDASLLAMTAAHFARKKKSSRPGSEP